jgi:AcrR family transcriptional regulator
MTTEEHNPLTVLSDLARHYSSKAEEVRRLTAEIPEELLAARVEQWAGQITERFRKAQHLLLESLNTGDGRGLAAFQAVSRCFDDLSILMEVLTRNMLAKA